jgi:hypothetical protein
MTGVIVSATFTPAIFVTYSYKNDTHMGEEQIKSFLPGFDIAHTVGVINSKMRKLCSKFHA